MGSKGGEQVKIWTGYALAIMISLKYLISLTDQFGQIG